MERLKKIYQSKYFPILAFAVLMFVVHIFMNPVTNDDTYFSKVLDNNNIIDFSIIRYNTASSRNIIEMVLITILRLPTIVWKLMDTLMFTICIYSIFKIFIEGTKHEREKNWMLVLIALVYPMTQMNGAGWGATTLNYLWPLSMIMFTFTYMKKLFNGEKIKWYMYIIYLLAFLYAGNHEQSCIVLMGFYFIFTILLIRKKKMTPFVAIQDIILIVGFILIMLAPGNKIRAFDEIGNWLYDYGSYTIIDKLQVGITSTMSKLICQPSLIFLIATVFMSVYIHKNNKSKLYRVVSLIPIITISIFGLFRAIFVNLFPSIQVIYDSWIYNGLTVNAVNYNIISSYIPIILSLVVIFATIIESIIIFNDKKELVPVIALILGYGTRVAIGMTPTVFASGDRTFIFLEFALIILGITVWNKLRENLNPKTRSLIFNGVTIIAIIEYLNLFITLV